jgi:hypothetical protein
VEFTFINQRIHSDLGLPPQISNEFKPFSRTLLPKPSFRRVHNDPMLFLWTCHFVPLLVILWYRAIRISSFTRRRHLLSFCHQIELRNSPTSCQWRSQFQIIWVDVRVKTRPEMKMTLEDSNIILYFMKGISGNMGTHKLNNFYIQMRRKKRRKPYLRYL